MLGEKDVEAMETYTRRGQGRRASRRGRHLEGNRLEHVPLKRLQRQRTVLLEVLLAGADKLQSNKLEAGQRVSGEVGHIGPRESVLPAGLEAGDDVANQPTLDIVSRDHTQLEKPR